MTARVVRFLGFTLTLLALAGVSHAGDTGVTLYEVSERVTFDPDPSAAGMTRRNATSPLQGFAALGTPLCPSALLISVPRIESCTVIATGTDSVSTATGTGPVSGTFDVVVNAPGNSAVHVPDLPVITGTFTGTVDLSLAVLNRMPLGSSRAASPLPRRWPIQPLACSQLSLSPSSYRSEARFACRSTSTLTADDSAATPATRRSTWLTISARWCPCERSSAPLGSPTFASKSASGTKYRTVLPDPQRVDLCSPARVFCSRPSSPQGAGRGYETAHT